MLAQKAPPGVDMMSPSVDNGRMDYKDLINYFGGASKAGKALGVCRQGVYKWQDGIPELRQYQIEAVTGGALRADREHARHDEVPA